MRYIYSLLVALLSWSCVEPFSLIFRSRSAATSGTTLYSTSSDEESDEQGETVSSSLIISRRDAISIGLSSAATFIGQEVQAANPVPAKRPTAYRVDSTIPPTLIGLNARMETKILKDLGKGSGTSKDAVLDDRLNLNNMLNKAVFGTINTVASITGNNPEDNKRRGTGYASFICLGVPQETTPADVDLAVGLLDPLVQVRKSSLATALGLAFAPLSTQAALDAFIDNGDEMSLKNAITGAGVSEATFDLYKPMFQFAKTKQLKLLALSPELQDIRVARSEGLQNVDTTRRAEYVLDSEGFISLTQDKRFRVYTERSLLKDFSPTSNADKQGNFFAERILAHETAATAAAKYAVSRPDSLVAIVAPIPDVRYLCGINGRIPRICQFISGEDNNKVTDDAVTTILLNPTARETLSLSRKLRLEIGTAPENIDVQTKVSDYLWFSSMPKVNLIPRLMSG